MRFNKLLIQSLKSAKKVVALTGAGISAESGIPTFREAQTGMWARYNPTELATPEAFLRDPEFVWKWYTWRRQLISEASPNPGHYALAAFEILFPNFTLITQNVDNMHILAGNKNTIELHGNIFRTICFKERKVVEVPNQLPGQSLRCSDCGSYLRPDVVWFGESLPETALMKAVELTTQAHVFLSIGTSGLVHPAASLPLLAADHGASVIEINPETTPLTPNADHVIRGLAGDVLPKIAEIMKKDT